MFNKNKGLTEALHGVLAIGADSAITSAAPAVHVTIQGDVAVTVFLRNAENVPRSTHR